MNAINKTFKLTNKAQESNPNPFKSCPLQEMIVHTYGLTSGFFYFIVEEKNDIARNDNSHF
jgi:hypothetical protein